MPNATKPPRWATQLLTWWGHPDTCEDVQGDLLELYHYWVRTVGKRRADWRYGLNALRLLRPLAKSKQAREYPPPFLLSPDMLRNYFTIAWRNLNRNRAFSAINIVGLSIGLATCILISLFVFDELSYDRYNEKADRIVRVVFKGTMNGEKMREANVMPLVAKTLESTFPEVQATTRIRSGEATRFAYGDNEFKEERFYFADSTFFQVFTLPLIKGDTRTALSQPNTLVISSATAQKYFGNDDPIGKVLTVKARQTNYTVTGVFAEVPTNSHVHFDVLGSMATLPEANQANWLISNFFTYLLLPEGYDYHKLEAKLPRIVDTYMGPALKQMTGISLAQFREQGNDVGLFLQPLTDIHLHSDLKPETELEPGGDVRYVYIFGAIAVFMLLLACINFMNLSTAGASKRAKEVGIRKALGSEKGKLVGQFLVESMLLTGLALTLAVGLVYLVLPLFNELSGKALRLDMVQTPWILPALLGFGLVVSLLAGSYPAFFLSSFKPIAILKGGANALRVANGRTSIGLRSSLVVVQFFVSISLMIGTTVVYRQLSYIQDIKLGYDKEQVLILEGTSALGKNEAVLRQQLAQDARVVNASVSAFLPNTRYNVGLVSMQPEGNARQLTRLALFGIDDQYLPTLGMKLAAGRNFSAANEADGFGVIINETAARHFGWGSQALGRKLLLPSINGQRDTDRTYEVIGVVRDFHFRSLHERIAPMVMFNSTNSGCILVKTRTKDVGGLLASVQERWAGFNTGEPFRYGFMDEKYQSMYEAEVKTGRILSLFAGLTIFVACLGLFGLATFSAEQRTKEIGVRKVLGASVTNIVALLSTDFLKPVLIALILASPVAWYAMNRWLRGFAYKIDIEWWMFALAGIAAIGIALLTVSFQSIKAALMNPVKSLRSE